MTLLTPALVAALREAAQDSQQDDFCTTRHEGQARLTRLTTPAIAEALGIRLPVQSAAVLAALG